MIEYDGKLTAQDNIVSCASMILSTVRESMPYMRDMGISDEILGQSTPYAEDMYISEAIDQIEEWEDRVTVREIHMMLNEDGTINPKVVLEDGEQY